jgi:hypothetical protein
VFESDDCEVVLVVVFDWVDVWAYAVLLNSIRATPRTIFFTEPSPTK